MLTRGATWLLLAPALALMALVFVLPLGWFLVGSLREIGTAAQIWEEAFDILGSNAVRRSMLVTNQIALLVTLVVLALGYPLAYGLARARGVWFRAILACIVLPYFTSVIVRTYAWMVLLGRNGIVNQALLKLGLASAPAELMYNRLGVVIGMSYVLLPYMVLTLYAAMRGIDPSLLRAAEGMGASPLRVFLRVFLPLTLHGVLAGALIVFILGLGFFVTPALMGGPGDLMIGMLIERQVELSSNWPSAALMSVVLLAATLVLYGVYSRFADLRRAFSA